MTTLFRPGPFDDAEARAFYDRFVASGPARLAWFSAQLAAAGVGARPAVEDLDGAVAFAAARLTAPGEADPPPWWSEEFARLGWTPYGACLADGVVHLTAELYRREVGATWRYLRDDPRHVDHQRPVMSLTTLTPPWRAVSVLVQISRGREPVTAWSRGVELSLANTRAQLGAGGAGPQRTPSRPEPDIELAITPSPVPGWTWQLWLDEGAEFALGREAFDSLIDRFTALAGVQQVVQEDREIFLLLAPGVEPEDLLRGCRAVIDGVLPGG